MCVWGGGGGGGWGGALYVCGGLCMCGFSMFVYYKSPPVYIGYRIMHEEDTQRLVFHQQNDNEISCRLRGQKGPSVRRVQVSEGSKCQKGPSVWVCDVMAKLSSNSTLSSVVTLDIFYSCIYGLHLLFCLSFSFSTYISIFIVTCC